MRSLLAQFAAVLFLLGLAIGQESPAPNPAEAQPATVAAQAFELKPDGSGNVPQEQIRELLRRVAENDMANDKRLRDYTYIERQETHMLDGHGKIKKTESRTSEVLEIYGEQVERLIAKDDKPLSEKDAKKEEEKIQKIIDKREKESDSDRRKRQEKEEKDREDDREFVKEVADAFNFRLLDSEAIGGRDTWVLDADPHAGYEPKRKEAKLMMKFKGRIWIDKAELQWVKLDMTAIDDLSFGWVLARLHKGAHVMIETTRVNDEVWLPKEVQFHVDGRLALFKGFNADVEQTFHDYKKFRADTKITVVGETE